MKELDTDNSGKVSAPELLKMMDGMGIDLSTVQAFIKDNDKDGDGQLDRKELIDFLQSLGC